MLMDFRYIDFHLGTIRKTAGREALFRIWSIIWAFTFQKATSVYSSVLVENRLIAITRLNNNVNVFIKLAKDVLY